jgi:hypothetical protein
LPRAYHAPVGRLLPRSRSDDNEELGMVGTKGILSQAQTRGRPAQPTQGQALPDAALPRGYAAAHDVDVGLPPMLTAVLNVFACLMVPLILVAIGLQLFVARLRH